MRKLAVTITCLVFLCVPGKNLFAQNTAGQEGTRTITTAVPFLLVAPDSRAGGMGEAGVHETVTF